MAWTAVAAGSAWAATAPMAQRPPEARAVPPAAAGPALGGVAVEGTDTARHAVPPELAAELDGWSNAGYRVRRSGEGEVTVEVRLEPLRSAAPFPPAPATAPLGEAESGRGAGGGEGGRASERAAGQGPAGRTASGGSAPPAPELAALAAELASGVTTRYQAVSAVLGWLVRHVVDAAAAAPVPGAAGAASSATLEGAARGSSSAGPGPAGPAGTGSERAGAGPEPAGAASKRTGAGSERPDAERAGAGSQRSGTGSERPAASPAEVLARRAGDAPAVARLAVALLGSLGIEARVVHGVVAGGAEAAGPRGPHAWIEVDYPDRGGVFSDPLYTHHYVPASYLPLPATEPGLAGQQGRPRGAPAGSPGAGPIAPPPPAETAVRLVERLDRRLTVDVYPAGSPGVTARKNLDRQEAGTLRVVVAGEPRGSAVLAGEGTRRARELVRGEGVFVGLAAGSYTLEVFLEGRPPTRREVVIAPRERSAVYLPESRSAAGAPPLGAGAAASPPQLHPNGGRSAPRRPAFTEPVPRAS